MVVLKISLIMSDETPVERVKFSTHTSVEESRTVKVQLAEPNFDLFDKTTVKDLITEFQTVESKTESPRILKICSELDDAGCQHILENADDWSEPTHFACHLMDTADFHLLRAGWWAIIMNYYGGGGDGRLVLRRRITDDTKFDTWDTICDHLKSYEGNKLCNPLYVGDAAKEILAFARKHIDIPECIKNFYEANERAYFQAHASYCVSEYDHVDGYQAVFSRGMLTNFEMGELVGSLRVTTRAYVTASIHHSIDLNKMDSYRSYLDTYGSCQLVSHETIVNLDKHRNKDLVKCQPMSMRTNLHIMTDADYPLFEQFLNYGKPTYDSDEFNGSDSGSEVDSASDSNSHSDSD